MRNKKTDLRQFAELNARECVPLSMIYSDVQPDLANSNCKKCVMSKLFYQGRQCAENKHKRTCNHSEVVSYKVKCNETQSKVLLK